ncbi:hypothetical protein HK101_002858 [Irineochytrium annulatum]|nr:hypothetical protein HK101_002858 [Irineochytrium annulatum]
MPSSPSRPPPLTPIRAVGTPPPRSAMNGGDEGLTVGAAAKGREMPSPNSDAFEDADEDEDEPVPSAVTSPAPAVAVKTTPERLEELKPMAPVQPVDTPHASPDKPHTLTADVPAANTQPSADAPLIKDNVDAAGLVGAAVPESRSPVADPVIMEFLQEATRPMRLDLSEVAASDPPRSVLQSPIMSVLPVSGAEQKRGSREPSATSSKSAGKKKAVAQVMSSVPASWPNPVYSKEYSEDGEDDDEDDYDEDEDEDYDTSEDSVDVRVTAKAPAAKSTSKNAVEPISTGHAAAAAASWSATSEFSTGRIMSAEQTPASAKSSGWFGSIYNAFQSFIDPEMTDDQLFPNGITPSDINAVAPDRAPHPDDDYFEGKRLFDTKQFDRAVNKLEQAAAACNHVEAMKVLAECYVPSRLANASKAAEWTKRRLAVMGTPEGMLQHAMFLKKWRGGGDGESIVLIRQAADMGHAPAMHEFGLFLRSCGKGDQAMAWFHRAAEMGHVASEEPIAEGYEEGIGVMADPVAGAAWRARVTARKKEEEVAKAKREEEQREITKKLREENSRRREVRAQEDRLRMGKEQDAIARRAMDKPLNAAVRNIEWGFCVGGIEQLHALANQGNVDARDYLDPDRSTLTIKFPMAMFYMGQHHASHADPHAAAKWYRRSAEAGYHEAMVTFAAYLIVGKGLEMPDPGQAMVWLMKAWEVGKNREAALALGEAYTKGIGVMPDPVKAVKWYTRAWEEGGYAEAAFAVGLACATGFTPGAVDPSQWSHAGHGGDPNLNQSLDARTVVKKEEQRDDPSAEAEAPETATGGGDGAAAKGLDRSKNRSVENLSDNRSRQPSLTSKTSTPNLQGSPSQSGSASLASSPVFSPKRVLRNMTAVKQDVVMASVWYRRAADKGHSRASNNLGELFMTGRGVPRDDHVGFALFRRAALAGLPEAEYNIGRCYREGRGCSPNEDMAVSWFVKAEEKGIPEATKALAMTVPGRKASKKIAKKEGA